MSGSNQKPPGTLSSLLGFYGKVFLSWLMKAEKLFNQIYYKL
jgi:hypothetical protein